MNKILLTGLALLISSCTTMKRISVPPRPKTHIKYLCNNPEKDLECYKKNRAIVYLEYRFYFS